MLVYIEDLKRMSGYKQSADIGRWLAMNGINFFTGKDGTLSTTLDAINNRLIPKGRDIKKIGFGNGGKA